MWCPPGEEKLWRSEPFKPYRADGFIYGRGVEDNGQALAASVFAARAVKETVGFGLNVGLALVSDEECGSLYGLDYVLRQRGDLFSPDDLILVPDAGTRKRRPYRGCREAFAHVRFTVKGKQSHASRPDLGVNTLRASATS